MQITPTKSVPASGLRPGMTIQIEDRYVLVRRVSLSEGEIEVAGPPRGNEEARHRVFHLAPDAPVSVDAPDDVRQAMSAAIRDALTANPPGNLKVTPHADGSVTLALDGWKADLS